MKTKLRQIVYQLPLIFVVGYLIIGIIVIFSVYNKFKTRMITDYVRMAEGVTNLMTATIDITKIDDYIEDNYSSDEYNEVLKKLYLLKDNYPDIYYLYIYKFYYDGEAKGKVIFDLDEEYTEDVPQESIDWIGEDYIMDEPFASDIDKIMQKGGECWHTVVTEDKEYLLSYVRPVFNENDEYICSVCVDFSMDELHKQDMNFVIILCCSLAAVMITVCALSIFFVRRNITIPLNSISACIDDFKFDTETERFNNLNTLEDLGINTKNEVGKLYNVFLMALKEGTFYIQQFNKAVTKIDEISELTFKDGLTSVQNNIAFKAFKESYKDEDIAIVMADINNLKYINDNYGHGKGDTYIKGCCKIFCDTFKKSPVYRIGGDEFIAVLKGTDFTFREELFDNLKYTFKTTFLDKSKEEWERYSMSFGMTDHKKLETLDETINRADAEMYRDKDNFKKHNGYFTEATDS